MIVREARKALCAQKKKPFTTAISFVNYFLRIFVTLLRAPSRGDNLSFLGVIGSVEKFPLVDLQLYFLIYKPEFTWNYDGIMEL